MQTHALANILRVVPIDLGDLSNVPETNIDVDGNFVDENGFFIRCTAATSLKYCPKENLDSEAITKTFPASELFEDPELCRKIFAVGSPLPSGIYIGYGV